MSMRFIVKLYLKDELNKLACSKCMGFHGSIGALALQR